MPKFNIYCEWTEGGRFYGIEADSFEEASRIAKEWLGFPEPSDYMEGSFEVIEEECSRVGEDGKELPLYPDEPGMDNVRSSIFDGEKS